MKLSRAFRLMYEEAGYTSQTVFAAELEAALPEYKEERSGRKGIYQEQVSRWATGKTAIPSEVVYEAELICGRPPGFLYRAVGLVRELDTTELWIRNDPALNEQTVKMMQSVYATAVSSTADARSGKKSVASRPSRKTLKASDRSRRS